jgi:uncharacterized membrane protein YuzA (DUF378 family)
MKWTNIGTLILLVLGGLNLGAMALLGHAGDFIGAAFGGDGAAGARLVFGVIGLSALWQLMPLVQSWRLGEVDAEAHHGHGTPAH